mgnify:CR=1 FL=1
MDEPEKPEIDPESVDQVVVEDEPKAPEVKEKEPKPEPKPELPTEDVSKLRNVVAYQTRSLEKAMRELRETQTQLQALRQQPNVQPVNGQELDEADRIAQQDWKKGVLHVVEKRLQAVVDEAFVKRQQAEAEIQRQGFLESELDKSRKRVTEKYPEVNTEGTEENKLFLEVLNEDPTLLSNTKGPEITMYRMEEKMVERGVTPRTVRPTVDREAARLARAGASNVIGRTRLTSGGEVQLTPEQKAFIKQYNIDEKSYRKHLQAENASGGVEA